jgi:preprotein translocase subunit SecG
MDFISSSKNIGSSAFGSSSSGSSASGSGAGGEGGFSSFFNLSIQKMVLILAIIAFVISVGTVAILLWKSKSSQKWPPEIAKCPDRLQFDGTNCVDPYRLGYTLNTPNIDNCANFDSVKEATYSGGSGLANVDGGYVAWEGIVDGQKSRAASLKCAS